VRTDTSKTLLRVSASATSSLIAADSCSFPVGMETPGRFASSTTWLVGVYVCMAGGPPPPIFYKC